MNPKPSKLIPLPIEVEEAQVITNGKFIQPTKWVDFKKHTYWKAKTKLSRASNLKVVLNLNVRMRMLSCCKAVCNWTSFCNKSMNRLNKILKECSNNTSTKLVTIVSIWIDRILNLMVQVTQLILRKSKFIILVLIKTLLPILLQGLLHKNLSMRLHLQLKSLMMKRTINLLSKMELFQV